jgi:hypothetical protein
MRRDRRSRSFLPALVLAALVSGAAAARSDTLPAAAAAAPRFDLTQAITDFAQKTTLAFDGLGMLTGNLESQSFFPPGKVADYWGFQYLRDNDPDDMGHNTSFLTRVACDVLFILTDEQLASLKGLASSQVSSINQYGYLRYPLMKAFRRLVDGDLPTGATGLDVAAVRAASRELYRLDGQISYDRAVLYARIFRSLSPGQRAYLDAMVGKGWASWPAKSMDDVRDRLRGLSNDESVAVMTYAGDMFSWYAGSVDADVYFCPERHGTYFGSFYMKDAPAIGHEGYSIDEQLTATAGSALCDAGMGYVTADQAAIVSALVDAQRNNLYAGPSNIVAARTAIATALRSLITSVEPSAAFLDQVKATVLDASGVYGELDGENVAAYATAFARVNASLSSAQKAHLLDLRRSFMAGRYADGTSFDFTVCSTPFLYAAVISDTATLAPYVSNTDRFFTFAGGSGGSSSTTCTADAQTMCLVGGRYKVTSRWKNQYAGGVEAALSKTQLTDAAGGFYASDPASYEYLIRVNTATDNGRAWISIPTFTDVEFWIAVTDTVSGLYKEYHSPAGNRTLIYDPSFFVYP